MWSTTATATTTATRDKVYARYADVATWNEWDHGTKSVELQGPFEAGAKGVLVPVGGPKASFVVDSAEPGRGFRDVTKLPGARLIFDHQLTDGPDGTVITHTVMISGPMTFLFSRVIGRGIAKGLPDAVANLARLA